VAQFEGHHANWNAEILDFLDGVSDHKKHATPFTSISKLTGPLESTKYAFLVKGPRTLAPKKLSSF
jgi:hypothetical protein